MNPQHQINHNSFSSRSRAAIRRAKAHLSGDNESAEKKAGIIDNEAAEGVNSPGMKQVATTPSASKNPPQDAVKLYKKRGK